MKTHFSFIDPGAIMGAIVALMILAVGVFAFFVTQKELVAQNPAGTDASAASILKNTTRNAQLNQSNTGDSVFNILGIVLLIGAIMAIVGLVYNYVR